MRTSAAGTVNSGVSSASRTATCGVLLSLCSSAAAAGQSVAESATDSTDPQPNTQQVNGIQTFMLPGGTVFQRQIVGESESKGVVAGGERLIYSNTKGLYSAKITPGYLVADDISTTAPDGCTLSRFTFQVTGKGNPSLPAAPYGVSWALYENCPNSWPEVYRPQLIIDGTEGSADFPDGDPRTIEFIPPEPVTIPTNFWLGFTFTGDNAGMVVGAPAFEGHTADVIDFPGFACNTDLGGFPSQPHASFNAEVFGAGCAPWPRDSTTPAAGQQSVVHVTQRLVLTGGKVSRRRAVT